MKKTGDSRGITLIALVVTILILVILTGVVFGFVLGEGGIVDKAVKSRFIHNFRSVEEAVEMYERGMKMQELIDKHAKLEMITKVASQKMITFRSSETRVEETGSQRLPVTSALTAEEKTVISTLVKTVETMNEGKTIDQVNLHWIDLDLLSLNMKNRYIIDVDTMQIYDYEGEYFEGKRWHTPEMGINESGSDSETGGDSDDNEDNSLIDIQVTPKEVGTEVTITITCDEELTDCQYKIGETTSKDWETYENAFSITSEQVLGEGIKNDDNTVTIFAKGTDASGKEIEVQKKIVNLDLDVPETPVISSNYGYPVLTEYGVKLNGETTITYDDRDDITNYYSLDGTTWNEYTGPFEVASACTIYAKSVKKVSGLEVKTEKPLTVPTDALPEVCYDEDYSNCYAPTAGGIKEIYLAIDSNMWNKKVTVKWYSYRYGTNSAKTMCTILDNDKNSISICDTFTYETSGAGGSGIRTDTLEVPKDAKWLKFQVNGVSGVTQGRIYEIAVENTPVMTTTKYYPLLTNDGVEKGYSNVEINYFSTSVQKLYKIDDGEWQTYQNQPIKVIQGQTIYAKGIDKDGIDTRDTSTYTATIQADALPVVCYDEKTSTYWTGAESTSLYLDVDSSIHNKSITYTYGTSNGTSSNAYTNFIFYDGNGDKISSTDNYKGSGTATITIPDKTAKIEIYYYRASNFYIARICEIQPAT